MIIEEVIMKNGVIQKSTPKEETRYVPLSEVMSNKPLPHNPNITRSKVLVIKNLSVTITQNYDEAIDFVITTDPGILSDNKTIPELDITAREEIVFDENITKDKLEKIIRRCGILDKYADYFIKDPEIIIDSYTLNIKKNYRYFNEFKEGILIGGDIFM
jgi:hypothetical protein